LGKLVKPTANLQRRKRRISKLPPTRGETALQKEGEGKRIPPSEEKGNTGYEITTVEAMPFPQGEVGKETLARRIHHRENYQ